MNICYGLTVINPTLAIKFLPPEPPTWRDWLYEIWSELIVPPLLLALSITAFRIAFGLL